MILGMRPIFVLLGIVQIILLTLLGLWFYRWMPDEVASPSDTIEMSR